MNNCFLSGVCLWTSSCPLIQMNYLVLMPNTFRLLVEKLRVGMEMGISILVIHWMSTEEKIIGLILMLTFITGRRHCALFRLELLAKHLNNFESAVCEINLRLYTYGNQQLNSGILVILQKPRKNSKNSWNWWMLWLKCGMRGFLCPQVIHRLIVVHSFLNQSGIFLVLVCMMLSSHLGHT